MSVIVHAVDRARLLVPIALMAVLGSVATQVAAKEWSSVRPGTSSAEQRIFVALDEMTQFNFVDQPLSEVILNVEKLHSINIHLDQSRLEEEGISTDTLVNLELQGIPLRSALRLLLRDFDLSYVISDGTLLITTVDTARELAGVRIYDVSPLVNEQQPPELLGQLIDFSLSRQRRRPVGEPLSEAAGVRSATERRRGRVVRQGHPGGLQYLVYGNLLVVRAPEYEQHRVEQFLDALAKFQK